VRFVSADGARPNRSDDVENTKRVKEIIDSIDWDCEVKTNFRAHNLGCRNAVSSGITWFFSHVSEGIILEDDCLPHPTFFNYCETLLAYYRGNEDIMHIGANNFQDGESRSDGDYYFSKIPHIWGWASWRRAWQHYDVDMVGLDGFIKNESKHIPFKNIFERSYWLQTFKRVQLGEINTWDYQWAYTILKNKGKTIIPKTNIVTNIGFGDKATHTGNTNDRLGSLETSGIENIKHPSHQDVHNNADYYWYKKVIPWQLKLKSAVKFYLGK